MSTLGFWFGAVQGTAGGDYSQQGITGSIAYLAHISRYDIMYVSCQLAHAVSKQPKVHMGAPPFAAFCWNYGVQHHYYCVFGCKLWGNNHDKGKLISAHPIMMAKDPMRFKAGVQSVPVICAHGSRAGGIEDASPRFSPTT